MTIDLIISPRLHHQAKPASAMAPLHAITLDNVDEIVDNLYLGGITAAYETNNLVEQGIRAVVCCVRETEFPSSEFNTKIEYFRVDVEDVSREPIEYFWPEATQFIHDHHSKGLPVFVHCRAGVSRSASTVIAYLMCHLGFTLKDAFLLAHRKRPVVTPNLGFMDKLSQLEKSIKGAGSIDLFKYESWWSGSHMAEVPDVGFGDSTEVEVEAESPSTAGPGSPGMKQSRSSGALKLQAASRKLKVLRAMSSFDHRHQVDMDVPKLMDDPRSDPVHRQRLERIRWLLMRQAAHDPELAYCQGVEGHLRSRCCLRLASLSRYAPQRRGLRGCFRDQARGLLALPRLHQRLARLVARRLPAATEWLHLLPGAGYSHGVVF